jgi:hypothetical protein
VVFEFEIIRNPLPPGEGSDWIPRDVLEWWMPKFDEEEFLDPMPLSWWQANALAFGIARAGDSIVGVCVLAYSPGGQGWQSQDVCEIRSAYVEPAYRQKRIFKMLCSMLLDESETWVRANRVRKKIPTFLASRNPDLRVWIKNLNVRMLKHDLLADVVEIEELLEVACWHPDDPLRCDLCPRIPGNAWAWPTYRSLQEGVSWADLV